MTIDLDALKRKVRIHQEDGLPNCIVATKTLAALLQSVEQAQDTPTVRAFWRSGGQATIQKILTAAVELAHAVRAYEEQARYGMAGEKESDVARLVLQTMQWKLQDTTEYLLVACPKMKAALDEVNESLHE